MILEDLQKAWGNHELGGAKNNIQKWIGGRTDRKEKKERKRKRKKEGKKKKKKKQKKKGEKKSTHKKSGKAISGAYPEKRIRRSIEHGNFFLFLPTDERGREKNSKKEEKKKKKSDSIFGWDGKTVAARNAQWGEAATFQPSWFLNSSWQRPPVTKRTSTEYLMNQSITSQP